MKTIDIIVPVYNTPVEDFNRCLQSIQAQTYENWRLIVVDDGSEGQIKEFLDEATALESRLQVIHTINKGPSSARNIGLDIAEGDYVTFCDADDSLRPGFLLESLNLCEEHHLDFVSGGICEISDSDVHEKVYQPQNGFVLFDSNCNLLLDYMLAATYKPETLFLKGSLLGRLYPKLIRTSIAKKSRFDASLRVHEDNLYCFSLVSNSKRVGVCSNVWYNYYINDYSITHKKASSREVTYELSFVEALIKYRNNCLTKDLSLAFNIRILHCFKYIISLINSFSSEEAKNNAFSKAIEIDWNSFINNEIWKAKYEISKREKAILAVFSFIPINIKAKIRLILGVFKAFDLFVK